jgi:hypothetical protein
MTDDKGTQNRDSRERTQRSQKKEADKNLLKRAEA